VVADENISDLTLIAEYSGEVKTLRNYIQEPEDSNDIMDLLRTGHSKSSLVICPNRRGNIARFISGINNSSSSKANLKCTRFNVDGRVRVLIYANKNIKKGELLCYDYNGLIPNQYDTQNFI